MSKRTIVLAALALVVSFAVPAVVRGDVTVAPGSGTPGTSRNFVLVGHNALFNRGMNAALAVWEKGGRTYAYVGNRTDGSNTCGIGDPRRAVDPNSCPHVHPGILILDVTDPNDPDVVGEIPASAAVPNAAGQPVGVTSRELRVWPDKNLLIELAFRCSSVIHACPPGNDTTFPFYYKFWDISDPVHPQLIETHVTRSATGQAIKPHEFYLWVDPKNADRAVLYESTPSVSVNPDRPNFVVEDISAVPSGGPVHLVPQGNWNQFFPDAANPANYDFDLSLHSMTPGPDGMTTYLAYLRGGFGILDTSKIAKNEVPPGTVENLNDDLITPVPFLTWGTGPHCEGHTAAGCSESHSAVPVPGRPYVVTVDEVYGTLTADSFGWPWGWIRLIDVRDPVHPRIVGEYKLLQNSPAFQGSPIYAVDIRNGLYIVKYTGPHRGEVQQLDFLEGNSNLGDALKLAREQ